MKRRKIYYVPGMISLIFLPILCVWYLNEKKNVIRCIEVMYARKYNPNDVTPLKYDTTFLSQSGEKRQYQNFYLTGNAVSDSMQIILYKSNAKQIIKDNDTINGIHINFGDKINYNQYVSTLDFFYKIRKPYNSSTLFYNYNNNFLLFENQLWFSNHKFQKPGKLKWECKIQCINIEFKPSFTQIIVDWIENQKILLKLWPFFLIFITFSIISIHYIKNKTTK